MRKMFLTGASLLVLSSVTPAFTNDTDKVVSATGNLLIDTINKKGIFQWVEGQFSQTSNRLEYGLTGFSVLSENKSRLQYLQTSLHRKGSVNALNLGFGIRNLTQLAGNPALVGVNLFLDTKDGDGQFWRLISNETFRRVSLGLELKTGVFDFSANYYNPLGNSVIQGQKVLKGYDVTAKGHIPNAEFLSIGVNTYRFSGVADVVEQGNKLIAEFKPNSVLTLRGEYDKPKDGEAKTEFFTGLRLAFNKPLSEQLKPLNISGDAWAKRYDKVERQYEIRTADALSMLGTPLSSSELTANRISNGDGTTEGSAYALQNGEQYDVSTFIGNIDDSLKTTGGAIDPNKVTVKVAKVSGAGEKGTDFELYASDGTTVIPLAEVTADSKFKDLAGGEVATLMFTYSADGFEDRVVYVSAAAISQIGSVLSDSDKTSANIKAGDGSSEANAYTLTNAQTYDVKTFIGIVPAGVTPTVTAETVSGTSGTDFQFKNGGTNVAVGSTAVSVNYTGTLEDKADADAAVIKLTYSADKFNDRIVYVTTDSAFAGSLTMADLVVPYGGSGDITVSTTQILGKLTVSGDQTQKSDWTIKSLVDTDNNTNLTVNGAALTISGAIDTPTTVTAVFEHGGSEYADQTKTFELSTGAGTLGGTPTGVSGKWGKTFDVDYKLNTSDTVGDVTVSFDTGTDFTFTIVTGNVPSDAPSGAKATTTGILDTTKTAINATTGAIDGTALTQSGDLLVKIVRAAKGGLPALTVYENITVTKQDSSDHPNFTVSAGAIAWATASTAVTYTPANLPTGIGTATYTLTATGTTAGATTGGNAITVASSDGKIGKTSRSGVVKVNITYAANDKYAQMSRAVDVTINKQTVGAGTLSVANLVVSYVSGTKTVTAADVLGQLTATGSSRSDWSVKSLADTDSHANVAVDSGGKSLTISGALHTTTTTITVVFESTKYNDVTKTFELSTRPAQVIDGTPTGLSSKWGKGTVTPDYKLDLSDQGQTFDKATDYTFSIVPSSDGGKGGKDATTAGIVASGQNAISNAKTGAIDSSKLTQSGKLLIKIVRAAKGSGSNAVAAATEYVNFDVTKQVLGTDVTTAPAVAKATGESGKWKDSTVTKIDLDYTLPGGTRATQYTWAVAKKSSDAPDGTLNIVNGDIRGATSGGTVEITMTATASNPKYSGSMRTADFTIAKQELGAGKDVTTRPAVATATGEDGKWKSSTGAKIALNYTLPDGTTVSDYTWAVGKTGAEPSGTLAIDGSGHISGATSSGTAEITITAKGANKKYSGSIRTADFAIGKQTVATNTLTVANLVVSYDTGNKTVTAADVLGQLAISSGSAKSDWTVKSLADTDSNGNLAVASGGKALTISGAITSGTTVTVVFESTKYTDVSKTFELSTKTSQISTTTRSGSGKWGKTYTTDYKLKTREGTVTFTTDDGSGNSDYTFTIVTGNVPSDAPSGTKATTTGILDTAKTAINVKNGTINGDALTKSGTLLVKIVRAAKGTGVNRVPAATEYENFTVTKQDSTDHTGFTVSAGAIAWATASTAVSYNDSTNKPAGISTSPTYALIPTGTTAGTTTGANAITVASSDGKIANTSKGGVVKVRVTYPTNDKYAEMARDVDVTINKQAGTGALTMGNLVIPFGASDTSKTVSTATITGKLTVPNSLGAKSEWTLTGLSKKDANSNITIVTGGKSLSITGAFTTSTTVTATFKSDKYATRTADFELSTGAGVITAPSDTRTGLSGKWGKGFTAAANVDYKLKASDAVGDTTVTFTTGTSSTASDYTFTIVTGNVPSDAPSGTKATTTGILDTSKTAIDAKNGAINGTALVKSGDLLVKIVRKAKGDLPALTDYQNITVTKQQGTDHPNFAVTAGAIAWNANSQTVSYTEANKPTGIGTATYALTTTGTTAGSTTGDNAITVASSDGKIAKTTQSGVVKVKITYAANDKYETITEDVDVTINKQTVNANTLSVANLVVTYVSGNKVVTAADVLGQLSISSGSAKSDWTVKSLADTDSNPNVAVTDSGKSLTLSGALHTTTTTITVVFESTKYADISKTFELSTRASQVIDGTPTGLTGKWGKGTVTPDYKLNLDDQGQTFVKATDYTFSIVDPSDGGKEGKDATTAGIVASGENAISDAKTGAIDSSKLTKSGKLLIKIVRAAKGSGASAVAAATEYVNFDVTKQVLGTDVTTAPAVATATGESGKWKTSTSAKIALNYTLPGGTTASGYTWTIGKKSGAEPDGTLAIDQTNGHISGATSSGTAEITITAKDSNAKYSGSMRTADFAIAKQVLGTDVTIRPAVATATGEDGKWKSDASAKIALNYTLPGGTTASDYTWAVGKKSGAEPSGNLAIDQTNGHISGATSSGTAEITITAKAANKKYSGSMQTADFAIAKQTVAADTLTVANFAVIYTAGSRTVSAANVFAQFTTTGSAKNDWTVKSLADTDSHGNLAVASGGKALTISGAIAAGTTVTVVFESTKYADVTKTFELSTKPSQISTGVRSGSGKWGQTYTTDYKLRSSVTTASGTVVSFTTGSSSVGSDYTFTIVRPGGDDGSGLISTTQGMFTNNPINRQTGAITGTNLLRAGTLLVKIVRAAKGTAPNRVPEATEYVNFTISKQDLASDITTPTVRSTDTKWGTKVPLTFALPTGTAFADYDWTVARKTGAVPTGTLAVVSDGITGATSAGTVVITMKAKSTDTKYTGQVALADFAITKQAGTGALTMGNLVIPYASGTKAVSTATIKGKLGVPNGGTLGATSDWTIKTLTETHNNLAVVTDASSGAKSLSITGAIPTSTTVTATFESDKYTDKTATFELSTVAGVMSSGTRTGISGKWGVGFTNAANVDYKLKATDTVGDVGPVTFTPATDYTFTIVAPGGHDGSNLTPTTAGILDTNKTAINARTGAIDGTALVKSGTLLVKIVRQAKGGLPSITDYQNITITKQELGAGKDVTTVPTVRVASGDAGWKSDANATIDLAYGNLPGGQAADTFDWAVAGKQNAAPSGTLDIDKDGKVSGATSPGTVVITVKAKANDPKYTGSIDLADFAIAKQTVAANTFAVDDLLVSFISGTKTINVGDVLAGLTTTGTPKSDWTVKSLADTDDHANLAVANDKKSMTISGAITAGTKVTVVFESDKYADVTKTFTLSTQAAKMFSADPTGLLGKWGKGNVTPTYNLNTSDLGKTFTPGARGDFTFIIIPTSGGAREGKDATTAGIVTGDLTGAINGQTGVIDTSKLTKSGKLLIRIVRDEKGTGASKVAEASEYVNFEVQKQVLGMDVTAPPAVAKATNEDGKWKASTSTKIDLDYTLPGGTDESDYTWAVGNKSGAEPDGTLAIDGNGDISGATSGGTAEITLTAKASNAKYSGSMRTADFTIGKQVLGTDVTVNPAVATATGEDGKWKSDTSAKIALTYTLPGATTATQYTWGVAAATTGGPSGTLAIDQANGHISGATSSGTAEITITANATNKKYSGSIRTADFAIKKQTAGGALSVANFDVSYASVDKTISANEIEGQLSVTGGASSKNQWTLKSLTKPNSVADTTLLIANDGKSMTIKQAISTVTITATFESDEYDDKTATFTLSATTLQVFTTTPTLASKWGKGVVTPNYNLKTSDFGQTFTPASDYTFTVIPHTLGDQNSGLTPTTTGIFTQSPLDNAKTGGIDTNKLLKSGTLLIQVDRVKKGGSDAVKGYVNFTVNKQVFGTGANADIPNIPRIYLAPGADRQWKDGGGKIDLDYSTNDPNTPTVLPGAQAANTFNWSIARKSGTFPSGTLRMDANGDILGATSGGVVVITMTAKSADPKYTGQFTLRDFPIQEQTTTDTLAMGNFVIPYGGSTKAVSNADIRGKFTLTPKQGDTTAQTQKSDWTIKSLTTTDPNLAVVSPTGGAKSLRITGAIDTPTRVTVVFEDKNNKYKDETKTFTLGTGAGVMSAGARSGTTGTWGIGFTSSANVDYNLKTTDTVGDNTGNFDKTTDFTFTIVTGNVPSDAPSGTQATTADIVVDDNTDGTIDDTDYAAAINAGTGAIDGTKLAKSGTLLVKIVRVAKGGLPELTDYQNITVTKQDSDDHPNFGVTAGAITWATASQTVTYTPANLPPGISAPTYNLVSSGTTAGTVAGAVGAVAVSADGKIANTVRGGVVQVKITYAANDKYEKIEKQIGVTINKQTETATLTLPNIVVPFTPTSGDQVVDDVDVLAGLSVPNVANSAKGDWTIKSMADTDNIGTTKLVIDNTAKTLTVKGAINTTTVTVVLESVKYNDKTGITFALSTNAGTMSTNTPRTGLSGTWGKAFTVTDYQLKLDDQVGGVQPGFTKGTTSTAGDYVFSIVDSNDGGKGGKTATTAGIVVDANGDNTISTAEYAAAINANTGAIDGTALTKSGTLLVKIVRNTKGGLPEITDYENIVVNPRTAADHTNFAVSAAAIPWAAAPQTVSYTGTNVPAGIDSTPTYTLVNANTDAGTVAGAVGSIEVTAADGKIAKTVRSGTVNVRITYAANDKYAQITRDVPVPINKINVDANTLSLTNLFVPFSTGTPSPVSANDILAKLTVSAPSAKGDWTVKSVGKKVTDTPADDTLEIASSGNSFTIKRDITTPVTLTVVFESVKYGDISKEFAVSTSPGTMFASTPTGTKGKWGKGFTPATNVNYNLNLNDTVGGVSATFTAGQTGTAGDYEFSIVASGGDDGSNLLPTTAGIVTGALTGAINANTGAIDGTKLIKSGALLVKIVRKQKSTLPQLTAYINITVDKQDLATDITRKPVVRAAGGSDQWRNNGGNVPVRIVLFPTGTDFDDYIWTVVGTQSNAPDVISAGFDITTAGITGALSGGEVIVTMLARGSNEKYTGQIPLDAFEIGKQTIFSPLSTKDITVPFVSSSVTIPAQTIVANTNLAASGIRSGWTLTRLTKVDVTNNLAVNNDNTLTLSGAITAGTTVAATFSHKKYVDVSTAFEVFTEPGTMFAGTPTGSGTWGKSYTTDYKLNTSDQGVRFDKSTDFTFEIVTSGATPRGFTATTANMFTTSPINSTTGVIDASKLDKSGTLLVKIVRKQKTQNSKTAPKLTNYVNFTVDKQDLATLTTPIKIAFADNENGEWKAANAAILLKYDNLPTGMDKGDFSVSVARKSGNFPTGLLRMISGAIFGVTSGGDVTVTVAAKSTDPKYTGHVSQDLTIEKQGRSGLTDILNIPDFIDVPYPGSGADEKISEKLIWDRFSVEKKSGESTSQTQKSEWTFNGLTSGSTTGIKIGSDRKSLDIKSSSANIAPQTFTASLSHHKYKDVFIQFKVSTKSILGASISSGIRSGFGVWGKSYTTTYNLKTGVRNGRNTVRFQPSDYTITIVTGAVPGDAPQGMLPTTPGITTGNPVSTAINNIATIGAIDGTKLTKSGVLLMKIRRASRGGLAERIEYENFFVGKQTSADHPNFTVSGNSFVWANADVNPRYATTNKPSGIETPEYFLIPAGTTAGTPSGDGPDSVVVDKTTGAIGGTQASGIVKVRVTYPPNDKYERITRDLDVTVTRQNARFISTSTYNVTYANTLTWGQDIIPTITGAIPKFPPIVDTGIPIYTPRIDITNRTSDGTTPIGGTIDPATGRIIGVKSSGKLTVAVTFPANARYKAGATRTIPLTINRKPQTAVARAGHETWDRNFVKTPLITAPSGGGLPSVAMALKDVVGDIDANKHVSMTVQDSNLNGGLTDGATYGTDYAFWDGTNIITVAAAKQLVKDGTPVDIVIRSGARANKAVKIIWTFAPTADGKYAGKTVDTYWRTQTCSTAAGVCK